MHALHLLSSVASIGAITPARVKDIKTAIHKLAQACQVPPDELDLASMEATYPTILNTYFDVLSPSVSLHTRRNTLQNLGQLYRAAHASMLITTTINTKPPRPPLRPIVEREIREHSPYRFSHGKKAQVPYGLPVTQWPTEIAEAWQEYAVMKALQVRQISLHNYMVLISRYMGYNLQYDPFPPSKWDQIFEIPRLRRYIAWMTARVDAERISSSGMNTVIVLVDIAKHQKRLDYAALQEFKRSLPHPAMVVDKKAPRHTASLLTLDQLGLTLMAEARQPGPGEHRRSSLKRTTRPGLKRSYKFMAGLIIRLLVRCPRRAQELRQMDLGGRLYRDDRGTWQIYYQSHQLKISMHNGQPNEFRMAWPPDLVDDLNEYLEVFRPKILGSLSSPMVFPTCRGTGFGASDFGIKIRLACWAKLHKHVFPHLFRTLWADAYLDSHPGDFEGAAAMLNDTPETVQGWYRQFRVEQQLRKATDFNAQMFGNGHGKGTTP